MEKLVGVIGSRAAFTSKEAYDFAVSLGKMLASKGLNIINGGKDGIMEAVCKGFSQVKNRKGKSVCVLPEDDKKFANAYCDIVIATGLGLARNLMIVNSADLIIAIDGGSGTLSELAFAWQKNKTVLCAVNFGGWAQKLASVKIDAARQETFVPVKTVDEIAAFLDRYYSG